jgi:lipopolysaccharide/colanic/teichoic acid biosynthesis glycosyltransferase
LEPSWKRAFDVFVCLFGLMLSLPVFVLVPLAIKLNSRGPVFFIQPRLGRHGRVFSLYKFRTMFDAPRESTDEVLPGNPEVTAVGRFLRRLKIDELPQLWHVLRGDMSIVGPRPALPQQAQELDEIGRVRLEVRPGLTGLAQVRGNVYLSWPERWKYDRDYVMRMSPALDLWILWQTVLVAVCGERWFYRPYNEEPA